MAVDLKFDLYTQLNATELVFQETTGIASINNQTGWGTPNDSLSNVSSWEVSILTPGASIPIVFSNPSGLPSGTNGIFTISPTDLGYTNGKITDGIYEVKYTVVVTNYVQVTYIKVLRFCLFSQVECCVKRMALKLKPGCCCDNKYAEEYILALSMLDSLEANAEFGNETEFMQWLAKLQLVCNWNSCNCGC